MSRFRVPIVGIELNNCHLLPALLGGALFVALLFIPDRGDVLTYDRFSLEPEIVQSGEIATLRMSVTWKRPDCSLTVQAMAWSLDGKKSFPIEGQHKTDHPKELVLINKPRQIQLPLLPPGDYNIGFDSVEGVCWPWERLFPIQNTPPKLFRFTVR